MEKEWFEKLTDVQKTKLRELGGNAEDLIAFCKEEKLKSKILQKKIVEDDVNDKTIWIIFDDDDLVTVIKKSNDMKWQIKKDYAVISYNDIPVKRIICGGITTISIDFFGLGKRVAKQILNWNPSCEETVKTFLVQGNTL